MSATLVWVTLVIAGLITFLERGAFILWSTSKPLPPEIQRALRYVAPAVFAAIVVPAVLAVGGSEAASVDPWWPRLAAIVIGCAMMWRYRSMPLTLVAGMGAYWVLQAIA